MLKLLVQDSKIQTRLFTMMANGIYWLTLCVRCMLLWFYDDETWSKWLPALNLYKIYYFNPLLVNLHVLDIITTAVLQEDTKETLRVDKCTCNGISERGTWPYCINCMCVISYRLTCWYLFITILSETSRDMFVHWQIMVSGRAGIFWKE